MTYAITFDLEIEPLKSEYRNPSYNNAYGDIRNFLAQRGFGHTPGSVYFGDDTVTAISTVLTIQDLVREFPWFCSRVIKDIRMLRIEEDNDLMPVVASIEAPQTPVV